MYYELKKPTPGLKRIITTAEYDRIADKHSKTLYAPVQEKRTETEPYRSSSSSDTASTFTLPGLDLLSDNTPDPSPDNSSPDFGGFGGGDGGGSGAGGDY